MKKLIGLCLIALIAISVRGQTTTGISRDANLTLFSGYDLKQQNISNNGYYDGVYADCPIFKNDRVNFGAWGVYDKSSFQDNMSLYKSITTEYAGGLNTGLYFAPGLGSLYSFYGGLAVGYKYSQQTGNVVKRTYNSEGLQTDQMLLSNLNLNLFKDARWFPRTQLITSWQKPFDAKKTLSENSKPIVIVPAWKNGYYEAIFKESLVDIPLNLSGELLLEPKLGISYCHYDEGLPESRSLIFEIALKKLFHDDFLTVSVQYKDYPGQKTDYFVYGISVNVLKLIQKKQ